MIKNNIENIQEVLNDNPELKPFCDFVLANDFSLFDGKKWTEDQENFYFCQSIETRVNGTERFESHQNYIDVHLILKGLEGFEFSMNTSLDPITDYISEKDAQYYSGEGEDIVVKENEFVVFYPNEAHLCAKSDPVNNCEKIVFKIKKD